MVRPVFLALLLIFSSFSLKAEEPLRIASGEYPPWATRDLPDGGYINLLVALAFEQQGIEVVFDYMPWNRALEATRVGKYLASSFWGYDPARESAFLHSDVIHYDPIVLAANHKHSQVSWNSLEDLRAYVFGATRGYTYSGGFWQLAEQNILRVSVANDDVENLKKLVAGKVDFFPISKVTGRYLMYKYFAQEQAAQVSFGDRSINASEDYLLLSKKHPDSQAMLLQFNRGLAKLRESRDLNQLLHEYMEKCCRFSH